MWQKENKVINNPKVINNSSMGVATEGLAYRHYVMLITLRALLITIYVHGTHCHVIYLEFSHIFRIFKGGWVGEVV